MRFTPRFQFQRQVHYKKCLVALLPNVVPNAQIRALKKRKLDSNPRYGPVRVLLRILGVQVASPSPRDPVSGYHVPGSRAPESQVLILDYAASALYRAYFSTGNDRSSHRRCFIKKVFLKISQNSQKNYLCQSLFF